MFGDALAEMREEGRREGRREGDLRAWPACSRAATRIAGVLTPWGPGPQSAT